MSTEETKPLTLEERLALATQTKKPGEVTTPTLKTPDPVPATQTAKIESNFEDWNSDQDFEQTRPTTTGTNATQQPGNTNAPAAGNEVKKPSVTEMRAGARSFTAAINMGQRMLFTNLSKKKALKPFTQDQLDLINEIDFLPKAFLKEEAQALLAKFHKNMKKHEKITKEIPFTDQETKDWELMLMLYQEETGKPIPQWLFMATNVVTSLGKRAFDIYFD